jgi:3-phosphoshikimate 1-carboxyvinyltransferase
LGSMSDLLIEPISKPFAVTIAPPGSKSLSNRAMILAALSDGTCELTNLLLADDTRVMLDGLHRLGFDVRLDESATKVSITGRDGEIPNSSAELFCGNSGTTIRFLTALCSLGKGSFTLDGVARMRQRPIAALTGLLKQLGARTRHSPEADGFPPVNVQADGLAGGIIRYGSEVSSQYLSAILMVAPYARHEVRIDLAPHQTSWPYVGMTMQLMDHFGITPELIRDPATHEPKQIIVPQHHYRATDYAIEPDASNASYFLAAAAISPGSKITIPGLGKQSLQGDVGFADVLRKMGAAVTIAKDSITLSSPDELEGVEIDLLPMPDMVQTLAVVALFANGPTTIHGVHTLRVKETDRLAALSNELTKLGATVKIPNDSVLQITPPPGNKLKPAQIATYDDHRMAMSFAIAGTRSVGVTIKEIECVNKTYPNFFADLRQLTAKSQ